VVEFCQDAGPGWKTLRPLPADQPFDAATLGSGPAVVLNNDSDNDPCEWMPEAAVLAQQGFRAVVWRYADTSDEPGATRDAVAIADAARGSGRAQMVGVSFGGRIVFEAAADSPSTFAGIVSVSGEREVSGLPDIRSVVASVRVPVLYLGSREDPFTDGTRQPRALQRALRSRHAKFVLVDGAEHGIALLESGAGASLRLDLEAFLARHKR
jgi:dienelactone hydrolase